MLSSSKDVCTANPIFSWKFCHVILPDPKALCQLFKHQFICVHLVAYSNGFIGFDVLLFCQSNQRIRMLWFFTIHWNRETKVHIRNFSFLMSSFTLSLKHCLFSVACLDCGSLIRARHTVFAFLSFTLFAFLSEALCKKKVRERKKKHLGLVFFFFYCLGAVKSHFCSLVLFCIEIQFGGEFG